MHSHTKQQNNLHDDVVNNNGIWRHQQRTKSCRYFRKLHPWTLENLLTKQARLMQQTTTQATAQYRHMAEKQTWQTWVVF